MLTSRKSASLEAGLFILRLGSIVLPLVGGLVWGFWTFGDEKQSAVQQAYENVALVRQYAQRLIETQTILQDAAQIHASASSEGGYLGSEPFHLFLKNLETSQSFTHGLAVIGLDGRLIASSRSYPVDLSFGERDYLVAIGNGSDLHLDRILLHPGGQDALVVAQKFALPGFEGAVVSAVGIEAIREFLRSIASSEGESASLLREDGKLLVRHVPSRPSQLEASTPALQAIQGAPSGHYEAVAVTDGIARIYAYSQLPNLPIYANFGVPSSAIWLNWLWRSAPVWMLLLAGGAFSWTLGGLIRKSFHERLASEEQARLRVLAEQKAAQHEGFMRELNHRVKNNLALVNSLIGFQMRRQGGIDGNELRARVRAISDVHDLLYRAADSHQVNLGALVKQLCESPALVPKERGIELNCEVEEGMVVDAGKATSLALILVELLTNAVKHAFHGRSAGTINVRLVRVQGAGELSVADDGVGFPDAPARSSGTKIVEALVQQLDGTLTRMVDGGTSCRIVFPLADISALATN